MDVGVCVGMKGREDRECFVNLNFNFKQYYL